MSSKKQRAAAEATANTAKTPRFAGWGFFLGAVIEFAIMELTKIPFDSVTMTVLIAMMVNGGICYAFSTFLEKNPTDAERIVKDWIVSTFIIDFIFVGSIAAYIGAYVR